HYFAFLSGQNVESHQKFFHFSIIIPKTGQWNFYNEQFLHVDMAITMGFILLVDATDTKTSSSKTRRKYIRFIYLFSFCFYLFPNFSVYAYAGIGLVVIVFSCLLSVFRLKYRGYPYR
ncbi:magnesium transporter protein 1, partial [Trichinella spiralis]|uniref:magnesium transporter protein 1 n=1 Tax=Trichinella spiralis TaxID=6334 RepID=UPI0001EFC973